MGEIHFLPIESHWESQLIHAEKAVEVAQQAIERLKAQKTGQLVLELYPKQLTGELSDPRGVVHGEDW